MNTNPAAYTVLCYGDSNTYGQPPDECENGRLPADVRWTGRLQTLLGERVAVIEEGLNGRTTELDYTDRPGLNGRVYLLPCLMSHSPLDAVVLMLGSNDFKVQFDRSATDIAAALGRLLDDIAQNAQNRAGATPTIILVSPIHLDDTQPLHQELTAPNFDSRSVATSRQLAAAAREVADSRGVLFADAATVAEAGKDGLHLSLESHQRLAELLAGIIAMAQRG